MKESDSFSEIKIHLATVIERLDNLIEVFKNHKEDDDKIEERVRKLETRIWGIGIAMTIIAGFIEHGGKWFK